MKQYQHILITGASGGLGEELVYQFAPQAQAVTLVARSQSRMEAVIERAQQKSQATFAAISCDLSDPQARQDLLASIKDDTFDLVIHNAGVGYFKLASDLSCKEAETMIQLNLLAVIEVTQALLQANSLVSGGGLIFVASQAGKITTPKTSVYSATKFGVLGYANGLRLELKDQGLHVMTVNPGPIATNFFNIADTTGQYLKQMGSMVLKAPQVAQKVRQSYERGAREVNLPFMMGQASKWSVIFPSLADWLILKAFNKK